MRLLLCFASFLFIAPGSIIFIIFYFMLCNILLKLQHLIDWLINLKARFPVFWNWLCIGHNQPGIKVFVFSGQCWACVLHGLICVFFFLVSLYTGLPLKVNSLKSISHLFLEMLDVLSYFSFYNLLPQGVCESVLTLQFSPDTVRATVLWPPTWNSN